VHNWIKILAVNEINMSININMLILRTIILLISYQLFLIIVITRH